MKIKWWLTTAALAVALCGAGFAGAQAGKPGAGWDFWAHADVSHFNRAAAVARVDAAVKANDDYMDLNYALWKRSLAGEDVKEQQRKLEPPVASTGVQDDALKIVKADPTDEAALRAIRLVLMSTYVPPGMKEDSPELPAANEKLHHRMQEILLAHHLQHPDLLKAAAMLWLNGDEQFEFWKRVYDGSADPLIHGNAAAMLMENRFGQLNEAGLTAQERQQIQAEGERYAREVKEKYPAVHAGPVFRLPRYMDSRTATLGEVVRNRETILSHSVGVRLPSVKVANLTGALDELNNYRGKIVIVDFWATWCGACRAGQPDLVALDKELAGKPFEIIGISVDDKPADVIKYMKETRDLPWVQWHIGPSGKLLEEWGVQGFPTYLVVDANGVVRERTNHLDDKSKTAIRRMVGELKG